MEIGEGMVAVVRGLGDMGLAVTLLDSGRQYTLLPNTTSSIPAAQQPKQPVVKSQSSQQACFTAVDIGTQSCERCDCGAQACDGRYATTYKTAHCNVAPTSPHMYLMEFPPQRAEACRFQGNFEVGGAGSGETLHNITNVPYSFKSGVYRSDRVSACSPKPSRDVDSFAKTLRRYPLPPNKSSEIVERLINYTQPKNYSKNRSRTPSPPTRNLDLRPSKQNVFDTLIQSYCQPETITGRKCESPTRDDNKYDETEWKKNYKRDGRSPNIPPKRPKRSLYNTNSVNMKIQVSVDMVSREVATHQRSQDAAVPLSPVCSEDKCTHEHTSPTKYLQPTFKCIQTTLSEIKLRKSVQTLSYIDLRTNKRMSTRKTKSEEEIRINKNEILNLFQDAFENSKALQLILKRNGKRKKFNFNRYNDGENISIKFGKCLTNVTIARYEEDSEGCSKGEDRVQNEKTNRHEFGPTTEVYRASVEHWIKGERNLCKKIISQWFNEIPVKTHDFLNRLVVREDILNILLDKIGHKQVSKLNYEEKRRLKDEIINFLDEIPLQVTRCCNKSTYLNQLADLLLDKLQCNVINNNSSKCNNNNNNNVLFKPEEFIEPTMTDLKRRIGNELTIFLNKYNLTVSAEDMDTIETIFSEMLLNNLDNICTGNTEDVKRDMVLALRDVAKVSANQAINFSNVVLENFIEMLNTLNKITIPYQMENFNIQNLSVNSYNQNQSHTKEILDLTCDIREKETNLTNSRMKRLTHEINEWITSLNIQLPQENRKRVVKNLAGDILDRCMYLELNRSSRGSSEEELAYLKYQIFKWVNKTVSEDNMDAIEAASGLMQRIHTVVGSVDLNTEDCNDIEGASNSSKVAKGTETLKISIFSKGLSPAINYKLHEYETTANVDITNAASNDCNSTCGNYGNLNDQRFFTGPFEVRPSLHQRSEKGNTSKAAEAECLGPDKCCVKDVEERVPTLSELNDEYEEFLQNWVREIPMLGLSPEELEKARMGLYNITWQAILKAKCLPNFMFQSFYFEDLLDDEIDKVLEMVPESPELEAKRQYLKNTLLAKTTDVIRKTRTYHVNFKKQLTDATMRKINYDTQEVPDPAEVFEYMKINQIVEDFILSARYKNEDKIKANIYKNKLMKDVEEFVARLKESHGAALHDINEEVYKNDILNALQSVPLPSDETIKQEADAIILGQQVEQWFNDLPLAQNDDEIEQRMRTRFREALAKRLHEMQREVNIFDSSGENALRHEVSKFLQKMPLRKNENLNINFMVNELTNRIKNRHRDANVSEGRKSVAFDEPLNYEEFSRNVDFPSTFIEGPVTRPAVNETQQYSNLGEYESFENRRPISSSRYIHERRPQEGESSQWLSLYESGGPQSESSYRSQKELVKSRTVYLPEYRNETGNYSKMESEMIDSQDAAQRLKDFGFKQISSTSGQHQTAQATTNQGILGTSQMAGPSRESRPWISPKRNTLLEQMNNNNLNQSCNASCPKQRNASNMSIPHTSGINPDNIESLRQLSRSGQPMGLTSPQRNARTPARSERPQSRLQTDMLGTRANFDDNEAQIEGDEGELRCRCLSRYRNWAREADMVDEMGRPRYPCFAFPPCGPGWHWPPYQCFFR